MRKRRNTTIQSMQALILFLVLESVAVYLIIKDNDIHKSDFMNSIRFFQFYFSNEMQAITYHFDMEEINENLVKENLRLKQSLYNLASTYSNSSEEIKTTELNNNQFVFISAKILHNSVRNRVNYIIIDKGINDGIQVDMGVITPNGLLGIVNSVSKNVSSVISILSENMSVSAKIKRINSFGPLVWDGKSIKNIKLTEIPHHIEVFKGDTVVTSGYSSIFPANIPIGIVQSARITKTSFLEVDIELFENYQSIHFVTIIKSLLQEEIKSLSKEES